MELKMKNIKESDIAKIFTLDISEIGATGVPLENQDMGQTRDQTGKNKKSTQKMDR